MNNAALEMLKLQLEPSIVVIACEKYYVSSDVDICLFDN